MLVESLQHKSNSAKVDYWGSNFKPLALEGEKRGIGIILYIGKLLRVNIVFSGKTKTKTKKPPEFKPNIFLLRIYFM